MSKHKYKVGQSLTCRVLDVDKSKNIVDLKEVSSDEKAPKKSVELKVSAKKAVNATVELDKDDYMVLSVKNALGVCLGHGFNRDTARSEEKVGESVTVHVTGYSESSKLYCFARVPENEDKGDKVSKKVSLDLAPGIKFSGSVKSVKSHSIFIQLPGQKHIGRLHICECKSVSDFKTVNVGDRVECKILEVQTLGKRTWIELTSRPQHMSKMQGLDSSVCQLT